LNSWLNALQEGKDDDRLIRFMGTIIQEKKLLQELSHVMEG